MAYGYKAAKVVYGKFKVGGRTVKVPVLHFKNKSQLKEFAKDTAVRAGLGSMSLVLSPAGVAVGLGAGEIIANTARNPKSTRKVKR